MVCNYNGGKLACLLFLACILIGVTPSVKGAVSCDQVMSALTPCITYLYNGGTIPTNCCAGVNGLNDAAKSTPDRQAVCNCMKSVTSGMAGVSNSVLGRAKTLPGSCGVTIPYKISPNIDCSKVK